MEESVGGKEVGGEARLDEEGVDGEAGGGGCVAGAGGEGGGEGVGVGHCLLGGGGRRFLVA